MLPLLHYVSTPIGPAVTMDTSHRTHNQVLVGEVFLGSLNQHGQLDEEYNKDVSL